MASTRYDHQAIEKKWQEKWAEEKVFSASLPTGASRHLPSGRGGRSVYILDMFPYPSGDGLHVGHPIGYIATDIIARYRRMKGDEVLHPMGWDAFGLPTENAAIKKGVHPTVVTKKNIANFKRQIMSLGFSYDWDREINTTDPKYYKWTQWIFLQLYKRGLAYESELPIWWCPKDKTGLANEEVVDGCCERCGTKVERKMLRQWVLKITDYAERLLDGLEKLEWPDSIKALQRNWIGKSEGAMITFSLRGITGQDDDKHKVQVFTTRPDTLFGATFLVISPEVAQTWLNVGWKADAKVKKYITKALTETEISRQDMSQAKTGVDSGIRAVHPATKEEIPVWVADYVLGGYGTGAIMAVPAHDERDFKFAKKFGLEIRTVITTPALPAGRPTPLLEKEGADRLYTGEGPLINSGEFDGLDSTEVRKKITAKFGKAKVQYKLRDWIFSRQRYWGEPIPLVHCPTDGVVPVPEDQLPLELPDIEKYEPTGTGESPLAAIKDWVHTTCPKCGGPAKRETNTMPQWAGSCWYYLRFADPDNGKEFASEQAMKTWLPVDLYVGGAEHAVLHLLYARFWYKVLFDAGFIPKEVGDEPFAKLKNQGLILGPDGEKMSKSRGNVINPDDIIEQYGADTLRMYEMFMGPFEDAKPWDTNGIVGVRRFLERVQKVVSLLAVSNLKKTESRSIHRTVQKITDGIVNFRFNTVVSDLMIFFDGVNSKPDWRPKLNSNREFEGTGFDREALEKFLKLLSPLAPHLAEELWAQLGHATLLAQEQWPTYDSTKLAEENVTIAVQVNGKHRGNVTISTGSDETQVREAAGEEANVKKYLPPGGAGSGFAGKKVIFVKDKLINFVV